MVLDEVNGHQQAWRAKQLVGIRAGADIDGCLGRYTKRLVVATFKWCRRNSQTGRQAANIAYLAFVLSRSTQSAFYQDAISCRILSSSVGKQSTPLEEADNGCGSRSLAAGRSGPVDS